MARAGRVNRPTGALSYATVSSNYDYTQDDDLAASDPDGLAALGRRVPHPMQDVKGKTVRKRQGRARNGEFDPDMQTAR